MIQGLLATVSAEELQRICLAHARRHRASAEQLGREQQRQVDGQEKQVGRGLGLGDGDDDIEEEDDLTWRDRQETQRLIGFHENRAADLEFVAGHLEVGEVYRLGQADRCYLGLVRPDSDFAPSYEDEFDEEVPF
jgi:hypothetical protein